MAIVSFIASKRLKGRKIIIIYWTQVEVDEHEASVKK
jgi:hypothetical protein